MKKQVNLLKHWWNKDCRTHQKKVRQIRSYLHEIEDKPIPDWELPKYTWRDLISAKRAYKKVIKQAKKASWRKFLEYALNMDQLGKVIRSMKPKCEAEIALGKNRDGTSMTPEQTINNLCNEHFPKCKNEEERLPYEELREVYASTHNCEIDDADGRFLSKERLVTAIKSFVSLKAPGTDGFPPYVYKNFGESALTRLQNIYKASFLLELQPQIWRDVKVIFIPKVGKSDYSDPRSFRPISLMQFMFKIFEKLMLWELEEQTGLQLHENQHGFRKGRSTDSTLTSLTGCIEKGLQAQHYTVAIFMDIKGAFDNIQNDCIAKAMADKGSKSKFIKWFQDFLHNRNINVEYKGITIKRWPVMGAPQGGVASPWMWNIIADELHEKISTIPGVRSEGFADDTVLFATDKNLGKAIKNLQVGVCQLEKWAKDQSLEFCMKKTKVIIFSRRNKLMVRKKVPPKLKMMGKELPYSNQHKNLGITFDRKLKYKAHLKDRMSKAKGILIQLSNSMGKLYGLKPTAALWVYKAVARAMLTHGCLIWHQLCDSETVRDQLRSFQRRGLLNLGFFRKSTPTAGLELITYTKPLPLFIKQQAALSYLRT